MILLCCPHCAQEAASAAAAMRQLQAERESAAELAEQQLTAAQRAAERAERQLQHARADAARWRGLAEALQAQTAGGPGGARGSWTPDRRKHTLT